MSHSDAVKQLPEGFESIASSDNCKSAAVQNVKKKFTEYSFIQRLFIHKGKRNTNEFCN